MHDPYREIPIYTVGVLLRGNEILIVASDHVCK
jgi:hypothetical protein